MKISVLSTNICSLALLVSGIFDAGNARASDVVLVDRTEQVVREVKLQTSREREAYALEADLGLPFGIFVDEEKNTYVTRQGTPPDFVGSVEVKYHGSDSFQTLVPADPELNGGLGRPFYPIVRGDTLFVSSWLTHQVLMFDKETGESLGAFVDVDIATGVGQGGLMNPRGIRFGPDDNLYVNSSGTHETLVYDGESGEYLGVFLDTAAHGIYVPCGIVFDHRGWVAVASASDNKDEYGAYEGGFAIFDWAGNQLRRVRSGAVCGLDRTSDGRILAAVTQVQEIRVYSHSMERDELGFEVLRSGATMSDMTPRHLSNNRLPQWIAK